MSNSKIVLGLFMFLILYLCASLFAPFANAADTSDPPMRSFTIRVVDESDNPIQDALVTPWMLGRGYYWDDNDNSAKIGPQKVRTDADGNALIAYPYYRVLSKETHTEIVSIRVEHPSFAWTSSFEIKVPQLKFETPHKIVLPKGIRQEVRPMINGQPISTDSVYAIWSEPRSYDPTWSPEKTAAGTLRLSPMLPESHSVLLAKFDGDRLTHLSPLVDFEVKSDNNPILDVTLKPTRQIKGMLDASVPRPVVNGSVRVRSLAKPNMWMSWESIDSDGSFTIEDWPDGESIQIVALCDSFFSSSGADQSESVKVTPPNRERYILPQCFGADETQITIAMEPLVQCVVKTIDESKKPVTGLRVAAGVSVRWWNNGIEGYFYGAPTRSSKFLKTRTYEQNTERALNPFEGTTDQAGQTVLSLPGIRTGFYVTDDTYKASSSSQQITPKLGSIQHVEIIVDRKSQ